MTPRRPAHRWPFLRALAVSLLLHAALVLWLLRSVHPAQVPAPRPLTRITLRPLPPRPVPDRAAPHPPAPPHRPGAPPAPGAARPASPVATASPRRPPRPRHRVSPLHGGRKARPAELCADPDATADTAPGRADPALSGRGGRSRRGTGSARGYIGRAHVSTA